MNLWALAAGEAIPHSWSSVQSHAVTASVIKALAAILSPSTTMSPSR